MAAVLPTQAPEILEMDSPGLAAGKKAFTPSPHIAAVSGGRKSPLPSAVTSIVSRHRAKIELQTAVKTSLLAVPGHSRKGSPARAGGSTIFGGTSRKGSKDSLAAVLKEGETDEEASSMTPLLIPEAAEGSELRARKKDIGEALAWISEQLVSRVPAWMVVCLFVCLFVITGKAQQTFCGRLIL